jgi:phage tail sheath protein FI
LNFIKDSFENNLTWIEQEPNNSDTRARVRQVLLAFLTDLFNRGMFDDRGGFENNVAVKCDVENNTSQVIDQRKLIVDVTLRFVEVAQDIIVNVESTRSGIITTEV